MRKSDRSSKFFRCGAAIIPFGNKISLKFFCIKSQDRSSSCREAENFEKSTAFSATCIIIICTLQVCIECLCGWMDGWIYDKLPVQVNAFTLNSNRSEPLIINKLKQKPQSISNN